MTVVMTSVMTECSKYGITLKASVSVASDLAEILGLSAETH